MQFLRLGTARGVDLELQFADAVSGDSTIVIFRYPIELGKYGHVLRFTAVFCRRLACPHTELNRVVLMATAPVILLTASRQPQALPADRWMAWALTRMSAISAIGVGLPTREVPRLRSVADWRNVQLMVVAQLLKAALTAKQALWIVQQACIMLELRTEATLI